MVGLTPQGAQNGGWRSVPTDLTTQSGTESAVSRWGATEPPWGVNPDQEESPCHG
jgi:hypothetical protein